MGAPPFLQFVQNSFPSQSAILCLVPGRLAFYSQAGREVRQQDAGRGFVDILPPCSTGTSEILDKLGFGYPERCHPCGDALSIFRKQVVQSHTCLYTSIGG